MLQMVATHAARLVSFCPGLRNTVFIEVPGVVSLCVVDKPMARATLQCLLDAGFVTMEENARILRKIRDCLKLPDTQLFSEENVKGPVMRRLRELPRNLRLRR